MISQLGTMNGHRVIIANAMKYKSVRRTWWHRLFTRPWQPLTKYRTMPDGYMLEDGKVMGIGDTITVNPITYDAMTKSMQGSFM